MDWFMEAVWPVMANRVQAFESLKVSFNGGCMQVMANRVQAFESLKVS